MTEIRTATLEDIDQIFDLSVQAYNNPRAAMEKRRPHFLPDEWIVGERAGKIVGSVRAFGNGHHFGGRAIGGVGIAGVAVAPEARGAGLARAMMEETLRRRRTGGYLISTLYPATVPLYRGCGYGYGGAFVEWKASMREFPRAPVLSVERFTDDHVDEVRAAYDTFAVTQNGLMTRDDRWWRIRILAEFDKEIFRYLVREDGRVTGWIVYSLESGDGFRFKVEARDLYWSTPGAARALLALASHHRSTAVSLHWVGPPSDPIADLFDEDVAVLESRFRWMLRFMDARGALEARGYNVNVEADVTIGMRDSLFPENDGPWRIEVSGGAAKVTPGSRADVSGSVQTWASVFTAMLTPLDAARAGGLEVESARALETLSAIFAGPSPWSGDFF